MAAISNQSDREVPVTHKMEELPGGEMPRSVYITVWAAFAWLIFSAWLTFGVGRESDFVLGFSTLLFLIFLGLPLLIFVTAGRHKKAKQETLRHFMTHKVDTATGSLTGRQAWVQIAVIPVALALAATLIGLVYSFTFFGAH
jgi:hypothetical protein